MWDKQARLVDVHDGDTVTVVIDQDFEETKQIKVRLLDVYAPELKQTGGIETRQYVVDWFTRYTASSSWPFVVTLSHTPKTGGNIETLGRYVGTITVGSQCLNTDVIEFIRTHGYPHGIGQKDDRQ